MVVCQLTASACLNANKKTGIKKKENGNLKCFTVLLSNQDRMCMLLNCLIDQQIKFRIVLTLLIRCCSPGHLLKQNLLEMGLTRYIVLNANYYKYKRPPSFDSGPLYFVFHNSLLWRI